VPDKILAAARGESVLSDEDEDDDDDEPEVIRPTKRRPRYKEISTDEDEDDDEEEEEDTKSEGADDDGKAIHHYLESEMGQKGDPFTDADFYMVAKHAAKFSRWLDMTSKDRWEPFTEKVGTVVLDNLTLPNSSQVYTTID